MNAGYVRLSSFDTWGASCDSWRFAPDYNQVQKDTSVASIDTAGEGQWLLCGDFGALHACPTGTCHTAVRKLFCGEGLPRSAVKLD